MSERDVEIVIKAKDLASGVVQGASQEVKDLGATTEKAGLAGKTAFWGLGQAAEELGAKIGITGQANRRLGNTVEELVSKVPLIATGFGIATVAMGIATAAYNAFTSAQEKSREEMSKAGEDAVQYVNTLAGVVGMTKQLEDATWNYQRSLLAVKREELSKSLRDMGDQIIELQKKMKDTSWGDIFRGTDSAAVQQKYKDMDLQLKNLIAKYGLYNQEMRRINELLNSGQSIKEQQLQKDVEIAEKKVALHRWEALEAEMATARKLDGSRQEQAEYQRSMQKAAEAAEFQAGIDTMTAYSTQARVTIANAAYKSMETQLMRLVEVHKFSAAEFGKAVAQAVKAELIGVAARASVWALYYTGMGLASLASYNYPAAALYFSAAGEMAAVAGATLAAAAAVNAIPGVGKSTPSAQGSTPTNPAFTSNVPTPASGSSSQNNNMNVYVTINNPLSTQNWQEITEKDIVPALNLNAERGVTLTPTIIMAQ